MKTNHPFLYQINTRVWLRDFDVCGKRATLVDVPSTYWDGLKARGMDWVWLMGVWAGVPEAVPEYCFVPDLLEAYSATLPDWNPDDVIGSPYAIAKYTLNPQLGKPTALESVRKQLSRSGLRLILDFVPNHFHARSPLLATHPDIFVHGTTADLARNPELLFESVVAPSMVFAHGKDPYFPPWKDTVQVNYSSPIARDFMISTLLSIAKVCDGVRCDMAMLALNEIFAQNWGGHISHFSTPPREFWEEAITAVKDQFPEFVFIAETYWGLDNHLQDLGFDFTYDKELLDCFVHGQSRGIRDHIQTRSPRLGRSIHFLENHDEPRAALALGSARSKAAATVVTTLPGVRFFYDGQWEGRKVRLPVQLGRSPAEPIDQDLEHFYLHLLKIVNHESFRSGEFTLVEVAPNYGGDPASDRILAWRWQLGAAHRLVVVNYSELVASGRVFLPVTEGANSSIILHDQLVDVHYERSQEEIRQHGLYVELQPYQAHLFAW